jgi:hypothetical protein
MFGPEHPRLPGLAGPQPPPEGIDRTLPRFGPFGTAGRQCFDQQHPAYVRIAVLADLRRRFPVLRHGRQYLRPIRPPDEAFGHHGPGQLVAWSRILDDEEALCIVNANHAESRAADVLVDADLNPRQTTLTVLANTAESAEGVYDGTHRFGSTVPVQRPEGGPAFVEIRDLGPSEVLVLTNRPKASSGVASSGVTPSGSRKTTDPGCRYQSSMRRCSRRDARVGMIGLFAPVQC